jgi:2-polyprenyl-3-methyl-5-hydroxy-6-metoxy-1,4-benzoquinol methylase
VNDALIKAYSEKALTYFHGVRRDIVDDLPAGRELTVLEVGCGGGATLALAKSQGKAARVIGIEVDPQAASSARMSVDEVIEGNVEAIELPFAPESIDVVILSEILEHLIDPWLFLKRLRPQLKVGGLMYASSPNVAHISVLRMLLRNRWDYTDRGCFDWTHLRWFTFETYREMIEHAGFEVIWTRSIAPMTPKQRFANILTFNYFKYMFMSQVFVKAKRV